MIVDITNKNPDIFLEKELQIRKKNNYIFHLLIPIYFEINNGVADKPPPLTAMTYLTTNLLFKSCT